MNKKYELKYTGEVVDLQNCDRITAIMVINGKMYTSDCDHQDCYEEYCRENNINSGLNWDDVDHFDEVQKKAIEITNNLFEDEEEDCFGFDIFEGYNDQYYLTSHFPSNMERCYEMMRRYAKENNCQLGTFFDSSYQIKLIKPVEHYEIRLYDMKNYKEYLVWKHQEVWELAANDFFSGEDALALVEVKRVREFDYNGKHFTVFYKNNDMFSKKEFFEPLQEICNVAYCRFSEEDFVPGS